MLGRKNRASTGTWVAVDGFRFKAWNGIAQDTDPGVRFGAWAGRDVARASGESWRVSDTRGARVSFDFEGRAVRWVTATGPGFGRARVAIDGASRVVDLYRAEGRRRVPFRFVGLGRGPHRITVTALGRKHRDSSSADVVVDAFVVPR